jgi:hypothetical protein
MGAALHAPPDPVEPIRNASQCKTACCAQDLCVAWTFGSNLVGAVGGCGLYTERGILAEAAPGSGDVVRKSPALN